VAVIPVILFHAGIESFSGGYVGVDVFFVISGYLITSILASEMAHGRFSLLSFYERRARRILPALVVVTLTCLPFAWMWMTPDQLRDFGRSMVAVTLFGSNFLFWIESGYFQTAAEVKPLLHTWSLAVEEQYYVLFPLLLMALWKYGRSACIRIIVVIALLSFATAQLGGNVASLTDGDTYTRFSWSAIPEHAFYLMPARAWELLLGSLCALLLLGRTAAQTTPLHQVGAATGLALILYAVFAFDSNTPFPGFYAAFPAVGTALIIVFATPETIVARALSRRLLVGMGLISYSAYLWHHPLFAFARLRTIGDVPVWHFVALSAVTILMAWISWRYVEKPFRQRGTFARSQIFGLAVCASAMMLAIGLSGHLMHGFESRFDPQVLALQYAPGGDSTGCNNATALFRDANAELCTLGAPDAIARVAVLGDSHAASLSNAFDDESLALGTSFLPINSNWCAPLYAFGTRDKTRNDKCRRIMTHAIDRVADDPTIETVVLVAEWANYTTGRRWGYNKVVAYSTSDNPEENPDPARNPAVFSRALQQTLARLRHKKVIIIKSVPEYHTRVPDAFAKAAIFGDGRLPPELQVTRADYRKRNREVEVAWKMVSAEQATLIETADYLCDEDLCRYSTNSGLLYMDDNHLSHLGAKQFLQQLRLELPELL
jgi:peptidoglycan/LPS O-acetylase OafA/YrhL